MTGQFLFFLHPLFVLHFVNYVFLGPVNVSRCVSDDASLWFGSCYFCCQAYPSHGLSFAILRCAFPGCNFPEWNSFNCQS